MSEASPSESPGSPNGPGALDVEEGRASVTFRRVLRHPIEEVWAAITEPEQLAEWFLAKVQRGEGVRSALVMEHPNGVRASGHVLVWSPPRVYEYEWNLPPGPDLPGGESSAVRWELSPVDGGTLLVLTHRHLSRATAERFVRGLKVLLDRLSALLDGTPLPTPPWANTRNRAASPGSLR